MPQFVAFLSAKFERIRVEVDAMNALLTSAAARSSRGHGWALLARRRSILHGA